MSEQIGSDLPDAARRVQDWLFEHGYNNQVSELPSSTRTAAEAAQAVGCELGQIVKSLVFRSKASSRPVLILVSGKNRVRESKVESLIGEPLEKADAEFVRASTGFAIGGVPPVGHHPPLIPIIDSDLMAYEEIWAAAGTPFSVFALRPEQLVAMTEGTVASVS